MKRYLLVIALLICSIGLDRWTKLLAIEHLKDEPMRDIVGRFFQLVFVENTGAFLSFGANFPDVVKLIVLTIMPAVLLGALLLYTLFSTQLQVIYCLTFTIGKMQLYLIVGTYFINNWHLTCCKC